MGVVLRGWLASSCAKERSTRLAGGVSDQVTSAGHDDDDAVAWLVGEPGPHGVDVRVSVSPDVRGLVLIQGLLPRAARGAWPAPHFELGRDGPGDAGSASVAGTDSGTSGRRTATFREAELLGACPTLCSR